MHLTLYAAMMKLMMKYVTRVAVGLVLLMCCTLTSSALDGNFYAENSKLASGKWVKIAVTESGIYQITVTCHRYTCLVMVVLLWQR